MVILDVAIVNVALPSIKSDLDFSQANLQWVISAYAIIFGGALLLGGRLADLLGRRRLFVGGPRAVRRQLAALRPRLVGGLADRASAPPGPRRSAARPGRALAADDDLRRGPRAQLALGIYGAGVRERRRGRRPARRRAHVVPELVVDLLHQRSGRPRRDRAHAGAAAREPRRARAPPLRLPGRGIGHRRADAARLRDDARDDRRLGRADDDRRCFGAAAALLGRVRRDRAALARRRCCRCGSSGCARSPARTRRWRSSARSRSRSSSCSRCTCRTSSTTRPSRAASRSSAFALVGRRRLERRAGRRRPHRRPRRR